MHTPMRLLGNVTRTSLRSLFAALVCLSALAASTTSVRVTVGQVAVAAVQPQYVCLTTDWWTRTDPEFGIKWGDAGIATLDLTNARFQRLVRELAPAASWRIGGTPADYVLYQRADGTWPAGCSSTTVPGGPIPLAPLCLTRQRWADVCGFARRVGFAKFYFGLNALYGRANVNASMDVSQIESLLQHSAQIQCPLTALELGNELGSPPPVALRDGAASRARVAPAVLAADIARVSSLISTAFPAAASRPVMAGPDWVPAGWQEQVLANTTLLAEATTHIYGLDSSQCSTTVMASSATCTAYRSQIDAMFNATKISSKRVDIGNTCGECGPCWGGGTYNVTNAFASSFWYLTGLGYGASRGMQRFCRSTLVGGAYELIDHTTMDPNPDYWVALLWTRLVGAKAFAASVDTGAPHLSVYAFCAKRAPSGALALLVLNTDPANGVDVSFSVDATDARAYVMRAVGDDLASRVACIENEAGVCVPLHESASLLPRRLGSASTLHLSRTSYAFVILPHARQAACA